MNLGQELGALQLRVWELEDELAKRYEQLGIEHPNHPKRYGLLGRVRDLVRERGPMSIDELTMALGDVTRDVVSRNVQVAASTGRLKRSYNDSGIALFSLTEEA